MSLIQDRLIIPERLVQAHADGKVVFFCGAGISSLAGLPNSDELVEQLYRNGNQKCKKDNQLDQAVTSLEETVVGGREAVREHIPKLLEPNLKTTNATILHETLLTLSQYHDGKDKKIRLVTTNFDRIFEEVIEKQNLNINHFQAPALPIPKQQWNGLVYLHGLLSKKPTPNELDQLVLSRGDFGLAYLTERWAARFITELFRNFTVCFIGYSINDPIIDYMVSALASDKLRGEAQHEMFIFEGFKEGNLNKREKHWKLKNVTPVFYPTEDDNHAVLHIDLKKWSEIYDCGILGKENIVKEIASQHPPIDKKQDFVTDRFLWALSDPIGLPAKCFADFDPVPPLSWLEKLSEEIYDEKDLDQFNISSKQEIKFQFSLLQRPTPYYLPSLMAVVDSKASSRDWDLVMAQLARWMIRHLNDPNLFLWIIKQGCTLHKNFHQMIDTRLNELDDLKHNNKTDEIKLIQNNAPNAIPCKKTRIFWDLLLTDCIKCRPQIPDHYISIKPFQWITRFKHEGMSRVLHHELRKILTPRIRLFEKSYNRNENTLKERMNWNIELSTKHVYNIRQELLNNETWNKALPTLFADFNGKLHDTFTLMKELEDATDNEDPTDNHDQSYPKHLSIKDHPKNRDKHDWTELINLTRDAWIALAKQSPERAIQEAKQWIENPYPLFKRLALFAAAQDKIIPPQIALDWLLSDSHWWFWNPQTKVETMQLLMTVSPRLNKEMFCDLEKIILSGPSDSVIKHIEDDYQDEVRNQEIWFRLNKIKEAEVTLTTKGQETFNQIKANHPKWELTKEQCDGFPYWTWTPLNNQLSRIPIPHRRRDLVQWLKNNPEIKLPPIEEWQQHCRDNFPAAACALYDLAQKNCWPQGRWYDALNEWSSNEALTKRSWRCMATILDKAPDETIQDIALSMSEWLRSVAKTCDIHEDIFLRLSKRILTLKPLENFKTSTASLRDQILHHPVGYIIRALLCWWDRNNESKGIPEKIKLLFELLCDSQNDHFDHYKLGRTVLAQSVYYLFHVDPVWTKQYLIPLFDWNVSNNGARFVWEGFLEPIRFDRPFIKEIKSYFLDTANHYKYLTDNAHQYASLLAYAGIERGDTFTTEEIHDATQALPQEGREYVAQQLFQQLQVDYNQRKNYWDNKIVPYLGSIWPNKTEYASPKVSENFGLLCLEAGEAFPDAFDRLKPWLKPSEDPSRLIHKLSETQLCKKFPKQSLDFLDSIIKNNLSWASKDTKQCLDQIETADQRLSNDQKYQQLLTICEMQHT